MSVVFSRASGVFCVSRSFCSCLLGWVAGCGGFRGSGSARPGVLLPSCWGAGLGCVCARPVPELSGSGCGRGRWPGSGVCASPGSCCVVGVGLCPVSCSCSRCCCRVRGGFSGVVFFRPVLLVFSWFPVLVFVVLPGVGGCGGCRVGFGVVFSPASVVLARACFRFPSWGAGLGLGWVLFGEFDPGSGRTLAACLTHASRTGPPLWGWVEWRTGEYHVSNLPPAPG